MRREGSNLRGDPVQKQRFCSRLERAAATRLRIEERRAENTPVFRPGFQRIIPGKGSRLFHRLPPVPRHARLLTPTTRYVYDYSAAFDSASGGRRCLHYLLTKHVGLAGFPCPRLGRSLRGLEALSSRDGERLSLGFHYRDRTCNMLCSRQLLCH